MGRRLLYVLRSIWNEPSNHGQRLRRVARFCWWQVRKRVAGSPVDARLVNGLRIQVWPDCDTSPSAIYYALPNSVPIAFLREHLNGGTFVDVGANVGLVSLLVADRVQHGLLFEPNPTAAERARENLRRNGLRFEVMAEALSDVTGTVEFENATTDMSCNRVVDGFSTAKATIRVARNTFDEFLREHGTDMPKICAVKIDVEGHENSVLRGMKEFLRKQRPELVMFEYLGRTDIVQALGLFQEVEYMVFELATGGPRVVTKSVAALQDLFACPAELAGRFGVVS